MRRINHYLVLPSLLFLGVALFYLYLLIMGLPFSTAEAQGWLMGPFPKGTLATIPSINVFQGHIQWTIAKPVYLPV